MPTYDYRCKACGHELELFQRMTERPKRKCPACSKMALERLIGTGGAVLFKGSGFYQTDYRSESYKKAAKAESESKNGSESKGDSSKSESCACSAKPKGECAGSSSGSSSSPKANSDE